MYRNILVPLDGSPKAEHALPLAARIARDAGATLTLLRVPNTSPGIGRFEPPAVVMEFYNRQHERAASYLTAVAGRPAFEGLTVNVVAEEGSPAFTILDAAYTYDVDLIVMASHRRSGTSHLLFGSVAEQVIRRSVIPVIVLRDDDQPSYIEGQPLAILVGLDGSVLSETALDPAWALASAWQSHGPASLKLVRVIPAEPVPPTAVESYLAIMAERLSASHPQANVPISYAVIPGDTVAEPLRDAVIANPVLTSDTPLSMIAIATHGRHGADRLLLGSVAETLIRDSKVPLLLIHHSTSAHLITPSDHITSAHT